MSFLVITHTHTQLDLLHSCSMSLSFVHYFQAYKRTLYVRRQSADRQSWRKKSTLLNSWSESCPIVSTEFQTFLSVFSWIQIFLWRCLRLLLLLFRVPSSLIRLWSINLHQILFRHPIVSVVWWSKNGYQLLRFSDVFIHSFLSYCSYLWFLV